MRLCATHTEISYNRRIGRYDGKMARQHHQAGLVGHRLGTHRDRLDKALTKPLPKPAAEYMGLAGSPGRLDDASKEKFEYSTVFHKFALA